MNLALLVWLLLSFIWGSTWLFIKIGLHDLPPFTFLGLRLLIAVTLLWGVVLLRRSTLPPRRDWPLLIFAGVLGFCVNYSLIFWGMQRISSGLAAVLQAMIPAFGLFFAHYYLPAERITWRKLGGVALGLAGVALIFYNQLQGAAAGALAGSLAVLSSATFAAYANVLVKRYFQHLAPEVLAAAQMSCGLVPLLLIAIWQEGNPLHLHWTAAALGALAYLSLIGSALAFFLYYWLILQIDVTKTMLIALVTPVLALLLGKLFLQEELTWRVALGSAAILSGIGLIVITKPRARA